MFYALHASKVPFWFFDAWRRSWSPRMEGK